MQVTRGVYERDFAYPPVGTAPTVIVNGMPGDQPLPLQGKQPAL